MIDHTITMLIALTKDLPIATNLALFQFPWPLVSGALLAGPFLSILAATFPLTPAGLWNCTPEQTPGLFHRLLLRQSFPEHVALPAQFREKRSLTAHLPIGIQAHRAKKAIPAVIAAP